MRRKLTSLLLALCMILSVLPTTALATGPVERQSNSAGNSEVSVTINRLLSKDSDTVFTAKLTPTTSGGQVKSITLNHIPDTLKVSGNFTDLAAGDYTLEITADNHLPYTQDLTVATSKGLDIVLYDDASVNDGREDKPYGVMAFGDLDGSGTIDDADAKKVVDGINDETQDFDLNNDDVEDVADIAYIVRNQGENNPAKPITVASSAALKAVNAEVTEGGGVNFKSSDGSQITDETDVAQKINDILLSKSSAADTKDTEEYISLTPRDPDADISEDNAVGLELDMSSLQEQDSKIEADVIAIAPPANLDNQITSGVFEVEDTNGEKHTATLTDSSEDVSRQANTVKQKSLLKTIGGTFSKILGADKTAEVTVDSNGNILIDLGSKVAIKKVSIRVTGTKSGKLADIAKVEFLEDFENRIPEPQLSIPTIQTASNTDGKEKQLTFSWDRQPNVSGYEVSLSGAGVNFTGTTDQTEFTFVSNDDNGKLKAYAQCALRVRSISGDWKSDWSKTYYHTVTTTQIPPAPQYVKVTPGVGSLTVSWDELYDAQNWKVYYKATDEGSYGEPKTADKSPYKITNLDYAKTYTVYVVAHNEHGDSPASASSTGKPQNGEPVKLPTWNCINLKEGDKNPNEENNLPESVAIESFSVQKDSFIATDRVDLIDENGNKTSPDASNTTCYNVITDDNPNTYLKMNDWDNGVANEGNFRIPIINLNQPCEIDTIRIAPSEAEGNTITGARIRYIDPSNSERKYAPATVTKKTDSEGRVYYDIVTAEPFTAKSFSVGIQGSSPMTVSEIKLYYYDPLTKAVRGLFDKEDRSKLAAGVELARVNEVIEQSEKPEQQNNPQLAALKLELEYAKQLAEHNSNQITWIDIDSNFNSSADSSDFAMPLTDYQPLGYVAASGDKLNIFVKSNNGGTSEPVGSQTPLKLVVTQYHPEVASWSTEVTQLCVGLNPDIEIPSVITSDKEKGGSLYICYDPKKKNSSTYSVSVQGATKIPMLNVAAPVGGEKLDDVKRKSLIDAYVTELQEHVNKLKELHTAHEKSGHPSTNYPYNASGGGDTVYKAYGEGQECILNSTEIVMDGMMFSFPATQVLEGLKAGAKSDITVAKEGVLSTQLANSIKATEQEVRLFYQFKGLNEQAKDNDRFPVQRLNIRYHQMFVGAFMYAGGKHIGIEWGSVGGLFGAEPFDENGDKGHYAGWGIAHEIGHVINNKAFVRAEVTNNVFAQLERAATLREPANNPNYNFRTTYDKVYKAVAAGNTGHTGDLAVQLAMFWQLHLAYDNDYAYKFYDNQTDQLNNLFYARLESYLRTPKKAEALAEKLKFETVVPLTLGNDSDQNFMRAACAAAEHDILDFFRAWGFTPDDATVQYAKHFPKEERLIQYVDDNSQLYRIKKNTGMDTSATVTAEITNRNSDDNRRISGNEVLIQFNSTAKSTDLLGYEIKRNDKVVAFVPVDKPQNYLSQTNADPRVTYNDGGSITYKDIVATENNKAFVYQVTAVDHLLKASEPEILDEVKIQHEGQIDKSNWTATTNMRATTGSSHMDEEIVSDPEDPDTGITAPTGVVVSGEKRYDSAVGDVIKNNDDIYVGTTKAVNDDGSIAADAPKGRDAEIVLNLGTTEQVTALKYTPGGSRATAFKNIYSNYWSKF